VRTWCQAPKEQSLHTYRQASRRLRSHASVHATDLHDFFSSIDTRQSGSPFLKYFCINRQPLSPDTRPSLAGGKRVSPYGATIGAAVGLLIVVGPAPIYTFGH
jgi:hypothetical protein